ncbi:hypothetical protein WJX81_005911 [Elliptochloris bilobata]|uniref:ABM domain-containing protein n=1 Tax=Elliptochloris bilobata TaxID=381761 RepID=A0AAW1RNT8_9CHLO
MAGSERGQLIGALASSVVLFVGGAVVSTFWSTRRRLGSDKKHKKAFLLVITCEFHSEADRTTFLQEFGRLAKYVHASEPDTLAYETAIADSNPLKVLIYERYAHKPALVDVHQKSAAYARFKEAVSTAGIEFKVKVGQSYYETDLGYM